VFKNLYKNKFKKISYSQCGEDLIVEFIFNILKVNDVYYLDIGEHHPYYLSNTALFYEKGFSGVLVEPDPDLCKLIKKYRKKDLCLNFGIGINNESDANFFIFDVPTLNTFSSEEALRYQKEGHRIIKTIKVTLVDINSLIDNYCSKVPNFVSIDIEGYDFQVLSMFNFQKYRPEVFCIETLTYAKNGKNRKLNEIINLMESKGYLLYADTYINSIFVEKNKWKRDGKKISQ